METKLFKSIAEAALIINAQLNDPKLMNRDSDRLTIAQDILCETFCRLYLGCVPEPLHAWRTLIGWVKKESPELVRKFHL